MNKFYIVFLLTFCCSSLFSQISYGGKPLGLNPSIAKAQKSSEKPAYLLERTDAVALRKQDLDEKLTNRFGAPTTVNYSLNSSGDWHTFPNGDRLWTLKIKSVDANALSMLYQNFYLPQGSRLFVYTPDGRQILGSYNHLNNNPKKKFITGLIKGEEAIIEYFEPKAVKGQGTFEIFKVFRVYETDKVISGDSEFKVYNGVQYDDGFGDANNCNININCTEGADWQTEKKGICRIFMVFEEGMGFCTGSLINTVEEDLKQYVLSAFHCQFGNTPLWDFWRFDFDYEVGDCSDPSTEPDFNSVIACSPRAGWSDTDFLLVEIDQTIPSTFDIYYNGWDATDAIPSSGTLIHHAMGDIKKISHVNDNITIFPNAINWNNDITTPADHHFRFNLDQGTFEVGSSGCPFFNADKRIVGQLNGGSSRCDGSVTYMGRMYESLPGNGTTLGSLQPFLDPNNTGMSQVDGKAPLIVDEVTISGTILHVNGQPMSNVPVVLSGSTNTNTVTDNDGNYTFANVAVGGNLSISPAKAGDPFAGVSTADVVTILRHILGITLFDGVEDFIAADARSNDKVSTSDVLDIQKGVLGIDNTLPSNEPWRFHTSDFTVADLSSNDPLTTTVTMGARDKFEISNIQSDLLNVDFVGVKIGDANHNVDPNGN